MKHKIFWEKNSRIKGIVPQEQIIDKTSTDKFPCDAVTIRMHDLNSKNPVAIAYFHGKESQHIGWGGQNHSFAETKLIVNFNKETEEYGFNGAIKSFSLQDLKEVLDSVREVLNKV
jgi:hypothetical protein